MPRYAQIDEDGLCLSVSNLRDEHDEPHLILIGAEDPSPRGQRWTGSDWEAVATPPPAEFYLEKVFFERRFSDAEWKAIQVIRLGVTLAPSPAWFLPDASTEDATKANLYKAFETYQITGRINLLDDQVVQMVGAFALLGVFGPDSEAALARASEVLTPALQPGEHPA